MLNLVSLSNPWFYLHVDIGNFRCRDLGILFFFLLEEENLKTNSEKSIQKDQNQQQTQPKYETELGF